MRFLHSSIAHNWRCADAALDYLQINERRNETNTADQLKENDMTAVQYQLTRIPVLNRVAALTMGLRDAYTRRRVYRQTYTELSNLTTRELDDLGIARSMIRRLATEAAYGK